MEKENFEIVDKKGNVIGMASRKECHNNPGIIHRVAHVLVFNSQNELYLQKRSKTKDIQPGKWDTSVGGHLNPGESFEIAAYREMKEELGIKEIRLIYMYNYIHRSECESEMVYTYKTVYDGEIVINREEIEEGKFWDKKEIDFFLKKDVFTPNFEEEYQMYLEWSIVNQKGYPCQGKI
ncbi:MAG: NUDIX domain-containing protein [bacterium]|nr:NUDIX domain-containing protein [bacterium]